MGYRKLIFKSTAWMMALRIVTQGLVVLKLVVITRLLQPSDFGAFAIVVSLLTIFDTLTDIGFSYAAIHMQLDMKKAARTFLTVTFLRGVILTVATIACIPFAVNFFHDSSITILLVIASLVPLLKGAENPHVIGFQKDLRFEKEFVFRLVPALAITISTIILSIFYKSASALVIGLVIGTLFELISSYLIASRDFSKPFSRKYFKKLVSYGKWITAGGLSTYLTTQLDTVVIGRILGSSSLGLYDLAFKTGSTAFNEITNVLSQIMFPVYSKIKNDKARLKKLFLKHLIFTTIFAFCINIPLLLFPKEIITLFFGSKWIDAAGVLQILAIYGFLRAAIGPIGPLFLSVGIPNTLAKLNFLHFLILLVLIIPLVSKFQITGAASAITISYAIITPYYLFKLYKLFTK